MWDINVCEVILLYKLVKTGSGYVCEKHRIRITAVAVAVAYIHTEEMLGNKIVLPRTSSSRKI